MLRKIFLLLALAAFAHGAASGNANEDASFAETIPAAEAKKAG